MVIGEVVRFWDGDCWRYGEYAGTIERSKRRFGWRRVRHRVLRQSQEEGWSLEWKTTRVRPDHVRKVL